MNTTNESLTEPYNHSTGSQETAIKVENITKIYPLYKKPLDRMKEALHPLRKKYHHDFYALHDISFNVKKGETIGIIGQNGSGKSTLLKIITGVLTPSAGHVHVHGRISSLLELGTGFNPELTGIENVYFNGTINGFTKEEMDTKVDDILSFADIGEFIYQPVKTYSSGMFARLAFAVAINIEPDIFIVDEVLSVGDIFFQQRCFFKFHEFMEKGVTILYVSHSMDSVIQYCNKAFLLENGKNVFSGLPKDCVDYYKRIHSIHSSNAVKLEIKNENNENTKVRYKNHLVINPNFEEYGNNEAKVIDFCLLDKDKELSSVFNVGEKFHIYMKVQFYKKIDSPIFAFALKNLEGLEYSGGNTFLKNKYSGSFKVGDVVEVIFTQKMIFRPGVYSLYLGLTKGVSEGLMIYHRLYNITLFEVAQAKDTFTGMFTLDYTIDIKVL